MLRVPRAVAILLALLAIAALILWVQRKPLARSLIDNELARRGVPASYDVTGLGFRWERIEKVRIGDPAAPDLTADWAELRVSAGLGGARVAAIRAGGVRLRGRLVNGTLKLGALDKLLPPPSGKPFTLPDLDVDLADARMRLDTPYGQVGMRLDGKGNLADGFRGKLATSAPSLGSGDCRGQDVSAWVDVSVRDRSPTLAGPVRAAAIRCSAVVTAPAMAVDVTLTEALDRWRGSARLEAPGAALRGTRVAGLAGRLSFNGSARDTMGEGLVTAAGGRSGSTRFAGLTLDGRYRVRPEQSAIDGTVHADRVIPDAAFARSVGGASRSAAGTPVAPLLAKLAGAVGRTSEGVAVDAVFAASSGRAGSSAQVARLVARARDGGVLRIEGSDGLRFGAAGFVADTGLRLSGGDLPQVDATFRRLANGETRGIARIAPYAARDARLALSPVRFAANPAGAIRIETEAVLDGPLGDGRVERLRMPVTALVGSRGSVAVNQGCAPLAWRQLSISGLVLDPATLRLCPQGGALMRIAGGRLSGGATIAAPRLSGRIGSTPLALRAANVRLALGEGGFSVDGVNARLGNAQRLSRLDIGSLTGRIAGSAVSGRFAQTSGQIGNVPLLIDDGAGDWALRSGVLTLGGGVTVSDEFAPARFSPVASDDVKLRLAGGQVVVTGALREPKSRILVGNVDIAHDLGAGVGRALLDVPGIAFGKALQPETLTRLTLGVVANVRGSVAGKGEIRWNPQGVTSTGRFASKGLDLAAAFGPVTGLRGEIVFTDLLGLETGPGQRATIDTINPGIPVTEGLVTYRLLSGQRLAVEGGRWPFAGGELLLDPAVLDLGQPVERRLTFRIVGMDAARFIQQLEFENLAATGTFDGVLPMVFDASGGRIERGRIVVRPGGGTIAYVGEVSNADLPIYGKLAFDALKSIRYRNLSIEMDGALDGEIVSRVNFNGVNQRPVEAGDSYLVRQFIGLPFIFNITIRAPFRGLLSTARTFQDPSLILKRLDLPVQPPESEDAP